jgi:hypothetical protein
MVEFEKLLLQPHTAERIVEIFSDYSYGRARHAAQGEAVEEAVGNFNAPSPQKKRRAF